MEDRGKRCFCAFCTYLQWLSCCLRVLTKNSWPSEVVVSMASGKGVLVTWFEKVVLPSLYQAVFWMLETQQWTKPGTCGYAFSCLTRLAWTLLQQRKLVRRALHLFSHLQLRAKHVKKRWAMFIQSVNNEDVDKLSHLEICRQKPPPDVLFPKQQHCSHHEEMPTGAKNTSYHDLPLTIRLSFWRDRA